MDVLEKGKKRKGRMEVLNGLHRGRPVSQPAGQAIEHAASSDESLRVRLQAKTALLKYHLAGYSSSNKNEPSVFQPTTQEPPLADPAAPAIPAAAFPPASASKVPAPASGPPPPPHPPPPPPTPPPP